MRQAGRHWERPPKARGSAACWSPSPRRPPERRVLPCWGGWWGQGQQLPGLAADCRLTHRGVPHPHRTPHPPQTCRAAGRSVAGHSAALLRAAAATAAAPSAVSATLMAAAAQPEVLHLPCPCRCRAAAGADCQERLQQRGGGRSSQLRHLNDGSLIVRAVGLLLSCRLAPANTAAAPEPCLAHLPGPIEHCDALEAATALQHPQGQQGLIARVDRVQGLDPKSTRQASFDC